ncbi:DUF1801 domain-containing protein [Kitasatospora sp. NBC_01539]|uniref:DUF1801 domain-containing protein n=1 Tax=Kitasatospora sp. NBC_01539 TaxID=2903577 RepID=UPI003860325F
MPAFATVDAYLASLPEARRATTDALLPIIEAVLPGRGAVWHGHPVWSLGPKPGVSPVCHLKAYDAYVTFGLWRGRAVTDPSGRLAANAQEMASVRLRTPADVDAALFTDWLRQAVDLG